MKLSKSHRAVAAACLAVIAALALLAVPVAGAASGARGLAANQAKALIKSAEVGYFGSASETYRVSVFVYSDLGPRAGNRITVCIKGHCVRAHGHRARLAWYSASFKLARGVSMGDPVKFTVIARDSGRHANRTVTKPLLCMHNNGSVPQ